MLIRGSDTSVLLEGGSGKISTVYFDRDDDDDGNDDADEKEDFSDNNEELLTFQVESLQEVDAKGKSVFFLHHGVYVLKEQATSGKNYD